MFQNIPLPEYSASRIFHFQNIPLLEYSTSRIFYFQNTLFLEHSSNRMFYQRTINASRSHVDSTLLSTVLCLVSLVQPIKFSSCFFFIHVILSGIRVFLPNIRFSNFCHDLAHTEASRFILPRFFDSTLLKSLEPKFLLLSWFHVNAISLFFLVKHF